MFIIFNTFYLRLAQWLVPGIDAATWLISPPYLIHIDKKVWEGLPPSEKEKLIKHEQCHIKQRQREGIKFLFKYAYYHIIKGYDKNPYEIEAYSGK